MLERLAVTSNKEFCRDQSICSGVKRFHSFKISLFNYVRTSRTIRYREIFLGKKIILFPSKIVVQNIFRCDKYLAIYDRVAHRQICKSSRKTLFFVLF
jgi:hypothetical protein